MPLLKNVSPVGDLEIFGIGLVEAGAEFECSDEQAGFAPKGTPGEDDYHPGEGLLSQVGNFEPAAKRVLVGEKGPEATALPRKATAKKTAAKKAAAPKSEKTED